MRKSVFVIAGILCAIFLGYFFWKGAPAKKAGNPEVAFTNAIPPKHAAPVHEVPPEVVRRIRDAERERENLLQSNRRSVAVRFYGRVVDETGAPVPDARIMVSPVQSGVSTLNSSDSDGRFSLDAVGPSFSVFVIKKGYHTAIVANGQFHYDPTARNPSYSRQATPALFTLTHI